MLTSGRVKALPVFLEDDVLTLNDFVRESNKIEAILREPTPEEVGATSDFLQLAEIKVFDLVSLVGVLQPGAVLRDSVGLNVYVGNHVPPSGGPHIRDHLRSHLGLVNKNMMTPYELHVVYEMLHPFTDGNGRSGRTLWAWQMLHFNILPGIELGFLHAFYYQTLSAEQDAE